jgi:post-segregation antitoxin (ccd killing protein)
VSWRRLRKIVGRWRERRWLRANELAIKAYNQRVSRDGALSDEAGLLL